MVLIEDLLRAAFLVLRGFLVVLFYIQFLMVQILNKQKFKSTKSY